ncbi:MAG: hypothetical protein ACOCZ6_03855 [Nanoarchaeota archaeon]
MKIVVKKRVQSHILEKVIFSLMGIFGLAVLFIFINAMRMQMVQQDAAMIIILFIVVLLQLAQTVVLIKIYEQHQ